MGVVCQRGQRWVLWWSLEGPEVRSCVDLQAGPMRAGLVLGRSLAWFLMS